MALLHINNCVKNCWNLCLYCQPVLTGKLSSLTWIKFDSSSEVSPVIIFESPLNAAPPKFVELPEPWAANRTRVSFLIRSIGWVFVHHWFYWPQIKGFNYAGLHKAITYTASLPSWSSDWNKATAYSVLSFWRTQCSYLHFLQNKCHVSMNIQFLKHYSNLLNINQ